MLEAVTLSTNHLFSGNPLLEQHRLRFRSIVVRQGWDVPSVEDMEYDSYDNPAAHYLIKRNRNGQAIGVSRLYPTDRPYMLQEAFPYLVTHMAMPKSKTVWEGSRFCIEKSLSPEERRRVIQEIVIGYLEFGLALGIRKILGVMYPAYWRSTFLQAGWDVEWMGPEQRSSEGHKIIAGWANVSAEALQRVREKTGIYEPILSFGYRDSKDKKAA